MAIMSIMGLYYWNNNILSPLLESLPDYVNADSLQTELLTQCAELEIIYPDPDTFNTILSAWCNGRKKVWERIATAFESEYNITENYDRTEEWTDTGSGEGNSENYLKGYPSTSEMVKQSSAKEGSSGTSTHKGRVHGNIGVRSAQELVEQEISLAEKTDLQQYIINDFKNRFCILVY